MALQLFRIGITLFRLGLCLLITGGVSVAVQHPQPLKIILHPPANAIITQSQPLFLSCLANYTAPYDYDNYDEIQEEEKMIKMKQTHFNDLRPDDLLAEPITSYDDEDETGLNIFKRNTNGRVNRLVYKWLKNGLPLTQKQDFEVFQNGTLKITKPKNAAGVYQCVADGSAMGIGTVISTSCTVQRANFTRFPTQKNISVEANSFAIINCPFLSVPPANITWKYENNNTIDFYENNRCTAQNTYSYSKPLRSHTSSLEVINSSNSRIRSGLLPLLQNETIEIKTGEILKLICVAYSEKVIWTFRHRNANQAIAINSSTSNTLICKNISFASNDGFYNCSTSTDFHVFDVTVMVPPTIVQQFDSDEPAIGAYVVLNCSTTGTKPKITWYKNGEPVVFNYIVTYDEPVLKINTYEEEHKGIYQCVASNSAGEDHSTALFTWKNSNYMRRPENVKCYPLNRSTMLIEYQSNIEWDSILYYTSRNVSSSINWKSSAEYHFKTFDGKIVAPISNIDLFEPFMFYIRGLEKTGAINDKFFYSMSRLSKGVKCALQGLDIYSIVRSTGIFIWWPLLQITNIKHLNFQFRYNDTKNPIKFSNQIIGTKEKLHERERWDDIQLKLVKIGAVTNNYPESHASRVKRSALNSLKKIGPSATSKPSSNDGFDIHDFDKRSDRSVGITEVRVSGDVTGILIPNSEFIEVRVLVPIVDGDEELYQDTTYVDWKIISKPSTLSIFQIIDTESRSITLSSLIKNLMCVTVCSKTMDPRICQNVTTQNSKFRIRNLIPNTLYRILLYDCLEHYLQLGEISVRTKEDVPGPITSLNIYNQNGWKLEWLPPKSSTGLLNINYYEIEWTINNKFHSQNISYNKSKSYFELPPVAREDKFNITVRAVSDMGIGVPIYINSENLSTDNGSMLVNYDTKHHDPTLGILIGAMLSILCILITSWIIIRYRTCSKHNSGHDSNRNTTSPLPPQSTTCNSDLHEMQTLITKTITLPPNGVVRHSDNGNGNNTQTERILLTSLMPEKERNDDFSCVITVKNDELNSNLQQLLFPSGIETNASNGATTFIEDNNAILPQQIHSNKENIFPSTPTKINGNLRTTSNPQYSTDSLTNTSLFDNSQQQLLSTTIDSNTSNINLSTLDENDEAFELNGDSSYSQQPLHNWSFRRPIIGPNG